MVWAKCSVLDRPADTAPSHIQPPPERGPNKLRITLNDAIHAPYLEVEGVWAGARVGSMLRAA